MTIKKKIGLAVIVIAIVSGVGAYFANKQAVMYGYDGIIDVVKTYRKNSALSKHVTAQKLKINISKTDLNFIKEKRDIAIDRGIQINVGDNYVACDLDFDSEKSQGEIRLKGHMTDHLQGNKWSYRVKSEHPVKGMYRFSIQHPGTRNYIFEWLYHQLLKNEDVIYLNYDFIEVEINEESLGIYALEEHFGQHVLKRNNRPNGAILRWNPELYWDGRIDEVQQNYFNEQYAGFSSSFVEPYDRGTVKKDSILVKNYQKGAMQLELFRRGRLKTSEVFDIERMARFHAIIDLVGGYMSLDWSDVKFYYNNKTGKIEPVGYESFSIRKTESISGQRIPKNYGNLQFNYHDLLFSDPVFFEAYIKNLERIVSEDYLHAFMQKIAPELDKKMGLIGKEWPYRKVSFDGYFENVKLIRNNINLPKPMHAFIAPSDNDKITITVAPVSDFPIQIIGIKRNNKVEMLTELLNVPPKARETYTNYFNITIDNPFAKKTNLFLLAKIPGSSTTFTVPVSEIPAYKNFEPQTDLRKESTTIDTSLISVEGNNWVFKSKITNLKKHIVVPLNVSLSVHSNQELNLIGEGKISVFGELKLLANSMEEPIIVTSEHNSGIEIIDGKLSARFVQFNGNKLLSASNSEVKFNSCFFYDMAALFRDTDHSEVIFYKCSSGSLQSLGTFNDSKIILEESIFKKGDVFALSNGSYWQIRSCTIESFTKGFSLHYGSSAKLHYTALNSMDTVADLGEGSTFNTFGGQITDVNQGFWWDNESKLQSVKDVDLYNSNLENIRQLMIKG